MSSDEDLEKEEEGEKSAEEYFDILTGLDNYRIEKVKDQKELTRMTRLAFKKNLSFIKRMIDDEARLGENSINNYDMFGRTSLHWTIGARHYMGYKFLLENGADMNKKTMCIKEHLEGVKLSEKCEGFTALMIACIKGGDSRALLHLLDKGADTTQKAKSSATAFHIAAASGSRDCMKLLYLAGCDPSAIMTDNRTAVDVAKDERTKRTVFCCLRIYSSDNEKRCQVCASCGNSTNYLYRCGKCYITFYCNRKCQLLHWRESHHCRCKGSIRGIVTKKIAKPKQFYHKKKRKQRPFIVDLSVPPTNIDLDVDERVTFTSDDKCVEGIVQNDFSQYDELVSFIKSQGKGSKHTISFWSQFMDITCREIKIYHGSHVPPLITRD